MRYRGCFVLKSEMNRVIFACVTSTLTANIPTFISKFFLLCWKANPGANPCFTKRLKIQSLAYHLFFFMQITHLFIEDVLH